MQQIQYGLIHCHSDNSLKDSVMSPTALIKKAKEYGAPAVTLTDHGTLTGIYEFMKAAKENEIKGIPGVEAYMQEDDAVTKRSHLLLLAKNYEGYKAICRAVTKSNTRIHSVPRMNKAILEEYFGNGTLGHGNVIATSACVGGILATILLSNDTLEGEIKKLTDKQTAYNSPLDPAYTANIELLESYSREVASLIERRDALKKLADKKYAMRERALSKLSGAELDEKRTALEAEKAESAKAADELAEIKRQITATKKRETAARQACRAAEKGHEKWNAIQRDIERLQKSLRSEEELYQDVMNEIKWYQGVFGEDFFIELQNHGIPEEAIVMPKLAQIAKDYNIPTVACNDAHFAENSADSVRARAIVNALRFNKWLPSRPDDSEYYIKTDAELKEWLLKILDEETVSKAMAGIQTIAERCDVVFPKGTHFPKFIGNKEGETSVQRLRRLVEEGIKQRYPNQPFPYRERVEYEFSVIEKMQYVDYLCIVQDYLAYGRKLGCDNEEGVGYVIGPGRGSAAGSLICYLIGITSVDPMPLGLIFERFLNPDRVSSPDIDCDMAPSVRDKILNYVREKYGDEAVCCIMTKGTLAAKAAIKSVARVRGDELYGDTKHFMNLGDAIAKLIPNKPNAKLADYEEDMKSAFASDLDALAIIDDAKLVEGAPVNYGMHAAGVIIADNGDVGDYIPLMWNDENEQWCSQCDMIEAEKNAGLLKFDFLGLRNLGIITETLRAIKRNTGKSVDIEKIPQDPVVYREIFQKGRTNFVFQFESQGMQNLLKRYQPSCFEDLILLNAMYRPGPMQFIDDVIEIKMGRKKPTYICEQAKDVLGTTYGYPIYQEQIMQLCNKVAGFTLGEADMIRRFMSKKQADEMAKYKPKFISGLISSGAAEDKAEAFWEQLMNFASYAFNKSHAAVYAWIAYQTAWLKHHYPTEYMTAVMNFTPLEKLPMMVEECKECGVKVEAPDINKSSVEFSGKDKVILFGLGNIKNVASGAGPILKERQKGVFRSFKDFLTRTTPDKRVYEALIDAGALDIWCSNRSAMKIVAPALIDDIKKIEAKKAILESDADDKKKANAERAMADYQDRFNHAVIPISTPENKSERLAKENELLGMYVSGHPLDEYPAAEEIKTTPISKLTESGVYKTVCGFVKETRFTNRKSDGKKIAFFKLEDTTDAVEVCCFAKTFEGYGHLIEDGVVLVIEGKVNIEDEGEENERRQIYASVMRRVEPRKRKLVVTVKGLHQWAEDVYQMLLPFSSDDGMQVVVHDIGLGELRETTLQLSPDVLTIDFDGFDISEEDI